MMAPFTLSAHSLAVATCPQRYYNYKVLGRRAVKPSGSKDAGSILHAAWKGFNRGKTAEEIDAQIEKDREVMPLDKDKPWFTAQYLKDAFAQLRAELEPLSKTWEVLEVEKRGFVEVGGVDMFRVHPKWLDRLAQTQVDCDAEIPVHLEYVRDLVVRHLGKIWIPDLKTTSDDRDGAWKLWSVGDQFKKYTWSWNKEHPQDLAAGVVPVRHILRKPVEKKSDKTKPTFEPQVMPFISYTPAILEEWRKSVLQRAADILRRNPEDPADWPLAACYGNCKGCDYIEACQMDPDQRYNFLMKDWFEASDSGKETSDKD